MSESRPVSGGGRAHLAELPEAVEGYLDDLLGRLHGPARLVRRTLAEAEAHLADDTAAGVAAGLSPEEAGRSAVTRFGTAPEVAARHNAGPVVRRALAGALAWAAAWLVGAGLLAIGVSGVVAMAMSAAWGRTFVWADPSGTTYSAADCAHFLTVQPQAHSCVQAAIAEGAADGVLQRSAAGVLGLVLVGALLLLRRSRAAAAHRLDPDTDHDAAVVRETVGTVAFGTAGVLLIGWGIDAAVVAHGHGAGQWLSGGVVSAVAAAILAVRLVHVLRSSPST